MVIKVDKIKSQPIYSGLPNIKVIGIGGGGGNVVNRMIKDNVRGVQYITVNTDAMALRSSLADVTIPIGKMITKGLGAGMKPEVGRMAAEEEIDSFKELLVDTDLVFLAAGMGGGTGTGAISVVAEIAKEMKILTVAVVTIPFSFEGPKRGRLAETGIQNLKKHIDTLVVIPNSKLLEVASPKTTMSEAFAMADDVLKQAISGITNLINLEGVINLDFADLYTVMANKGSAYMGTGVGRGDNRGLMAVKKALSSPLISQPIDGATGIIINIVADEQFPLFDAEAAAEYIQSSANQDADVIFGLVYDPKLKEEVSVTVIATGYDSQYKIEAAELVERIPLRVSDSISQPILKNRPRNPSDSSKYPAEEIEVPHFMRRRLPT
ncbi:MAG: cell division protein FtsZ [bacterium]